MADYPQNRVYCVLPLEKVKECVGDVLECARKSVDGKFIVWDFAADDVRLEELRRDSELKFFTHDEILKAMSSAAWVSPDVEEVRAFDFSCSSF